MPTITVVNDLPLETYLRGVVPSEMSSTWPTAALTAQAIASRSYAARRLHPTTSYYDVPDDSSSQVYHGALGEHASTNAIIAATAGVVLRSGSSIANTLYHSAGGGGTENNENVYTSSTGAKVAGAVSYLRGSMDRDATGKSYDAASPYATWATLTYTRSQLSRLVRRRHAHERRHAHRHRPAEPRRVGAPDQRDADRVGGDEARLGRRLPERLQRPPTGADPMLRSTLFATAPIP